ncbi:MAG TPA: FlgD immunoglobulin-like domain containing protein [Gemmatimonadales bacterium]|jgi:hypothetical protein
MTRAAALGAALVLMLACASRPTAAFAQTPAELLAQGLRAYDELDFDAAASLIRTAVGAGAFATMPPQRQAEILTYLGAAERFRGNVDSTFSVFRSIVARHPLYQIDELIFPPEVTSLFTVVRRRTPAIELRAPQQQRLEFEPGQGRLVAWAYPSATHDLLVQVMTGDGRTVRTVYAGPIGDSLEIRWDGRDSSGSVVASGAYTLAVQSRGASGRVERMVQLPVDVERLTVDTLAPPLPPAASVFLPERREGGPGFEALLGGVLAGAAVAVVPSVISSDAKPSGVRFAVGTALSLGGVAAFLQRRPGALLAENVAFNDSLRAAWRDSVEVVTTLNQGLQRAPALIMRIGTATRVELGG